MALLYLSSSAHKALNAGIGKAVDASGTNYGYVLLTTAADVTVARCSFSENAFNAPSGDAITALSIEPEDSTAAGTVTKCKIYTAGGALVLTCSVGVTGSGADIELASNVFLAAERLEWTGFSISMTVTAYA